MFLSCYKFTDVNAYCPLAESILIATYTTQRQKTSRQTGTIAKQKDAFNTAHFHTLGLGYANLQGGIYCSTGAIMNGCPSDATNDS